MLLFGAVCNADVNVQIISVWGIICSFSWPSWLDRKFRLNVVTHILINMCLRYFNVSQMNCDLKLTGKCGGFVYHSPSPLLNQGCRFWLRRHDSILLFLMRSQSCNGTGVPNHMCPVSLLLFVSEILFTLPCWSLVPVHPPRSASSGAQLEGCVSADCNTYAFVGHSLLVRKELVEVLSDITRDVWNFTVA